MAIKGCPVSVMYLSHVSNNRHEKVQDLQSEHWHMIYIMPVVYADILFF